jgi:hypothetical protein
VPITAPRRQSVSGVCTSPELPVGRKRIEASTWPVMQTARRLRLPASDRTVSQRPDGDNADGRAFAERCEGDRHHFRTIISPDDAGELVSLRSFTCELMDDQAACDLCARVGWVAIDHWNTGHPHIHILVYSRAADRSDLVISRDYITTGLRARAGELLRAPGSPTSSWSSSSF